MSIFDDEAPEWDTAERVERARNVADAVREHVALTPTTRAIDVGAGTGLLGLDLLPDIESVVLADPSQGMVEQARSKIAAEGIANASAIEFDMPGEPPPGSPFDLVTSMLALHHIEDTDAVLHSAFDMLAPGGTLALVDLDAEDGSFHDDDDHGVHHNGFERSLIESKVRDGGFTAVSTRIIFDIEHEGRPYPLFLLVGSKPKGATPR